MYFYIFVTVFMYLSYFATQCTIPTYKPTADKNIPPLEASGVGEFCLRELMHGKFLTMVHKFEIWKFIYVFFWKKAVFCEGSVLLNAVWPGSNI